MEYIDVGTLVKQIGPALPNQAELPPESRALLSSLDSQIAASFAAAPGGLDIRVEGTTHVPPELAGQIAAAAQEGDPAEAFSRLPADTLVALGSGLPPIGPETDDLLGQALQQYADLLDLPELASVDLHPSQWLGGAFALGGNSGSLGEPDGQPNVYLVAQVSDPAAAQADLDGLTALLPPKSATPVTIAGASMMQFVPDGLQPVTYGVTDGWLYGVSGDAESVVEAASDASIDANPRYAALHTALGGDRINLFVDAQGIRELASSMLSPNERSLYEAGVRPVVAPITFFGGGQRSDPNGDTHAHFVLGIQKP
jgi:hypothetical protein